MLSKLHLSTTIFLIVLALCASAAASGRARQLGIGLGITETSTDFMVNFWLSEYFSLEPSFAFRDLSPEGDGGFTRYIPGLGFLYHWSADKDLRPYVGLRGAFDVLSGADGKYTDVSVSPVFGGEYFFSDNFSVSGEYQVVLIVTDDELSPGLLPANSTTVETVEFLSVHFYF